MAETVCESVKEHWDYLTRNIPQEVTAKWWNIIFDGYNEPHRKYHTITHIQNMFQHYNSYKKDLENNDAIQYAILFHDLVYNPQCVDNEEKSIELFESFVKEANLSKELHDSVEELISLTKTHSTEEHKIDGAFGKEDKHYFLDFDMSILGSEPAEYHTYSRQIQEEYNFLPENTFKTLRAKILKSFLLIPNIFATQKFREAYESQARDNIEQEITELKP